MNFNGFQKLSLQLKKTVCFLCRSTSGFYSNPEETSRENVSDTGRPGQK
jgi:hypothetical protein